MLVELSLVPRRRDDHARMCQGAQEPWHGRCPVGENQRNLSVQLIVFVLEATQYRERYDADERRRRAQDVHARVGGQSDGGDQPETGGGCQSLDAGTGPEDRTATE